MWQQNKRVEAQTALETGIKLDPDSPDLHNYLASLFLGTGDVVAAEKEFREAVKINPAVAEWQSNLVNLLASRGETADARYHLEQSIRVNPHYAAARLNYARLLANTNQFDLLPLIRPQCNHRIDPRCFPRRNVPGDRRNRNKKRSYLDKCDGVAGRDSKQQAAQRARQNSGPGHS